ncbi:MAG: hypothetical protein A2445_02300 [Candidatus Jacksonbacteria bacterium RIFOXYC2_FULL_44_29]|nr:MAG: hypothetical protein A2240_03180 [Candidatus Jacksonbacteria bacterium RIFOXYA2_FULL_43_12]OGY76985.1 MAG: hypothetical protein A2295_01285 [Candidatus Jacksonbacteria bacterium RIFOXYB2_FULL_44_15]OGY77837.1 MAG: hypothetical protein A2445_02300 [Candidatus Jacksonbacteria bacterium RIFOXYC2_FULL_44_29]OGY80254.1 MAG: hypothetical protein A2550_03950 [Candidatus Jacksonbacteria bacterium RIFOXYD2_FULL_43_21]HBH46113.1 hypothetical protein [Candidatus Jacksonbacteria bacterium]
MPTNNQTDQQLKIAWDKAMVLHNEGKFGEAITAWQAVRELLPRAEQWLADYNLAGSFYENGQSDLAIAHFEGAIAEMPPEEKPKYEAAAEDWVALARQEITEAQLNVKTAVQMETGPLANLAEIPAEMIFVDNAPAPVSPIIEPLIQTPAEVPSVAPAATVESEKMPEDPPENIPIRLIPLGGGEDIEVPVEPEIEAPVVEQVAVADVPQISVEQIEPAPIIDVAPVASAPVAPPVEDAATVEERAKLASLLEEVKTMTQERQALAQPEKFDWQNLGASLRQGVANLKDAVAGLARQIT